MVVRFLPEHEPQEVERAADRGDLAEVIELRSRLPQAVAASRAAGDAWSEGWDEGAPESGPEPEPEFHFELEAEPEPELEAGAGGEADSDPGPAQLPTSLPVLEHEPDAASDNAARSRGRRAPREVVRLVTNAEAAEPAEPAASDASEDAVRLLARRARSSGELRRELAALGYPQAEVESVVLECESRLYLDDLGLARVLCEGLRERKRASRAQIRMKLRERLLPDGVIEQVLGELDDDEEHELLLQAAAERARKLRGLDRQTAERRLLGFLARRGWSGQSASRAAREALDQQGMRAQPSGGSVRFQ